MVYVQSREFPAISFLLNDTQKTGWSNWRQGPLFHRIIGSNIWVRLSGYTKKVNGPLAEILHSWFIIQAVLVEILSALNFYIKNQMCSNLSLQMSMCKKVLKGFPCVHNMNCFKGINFQILIRHGSFP